MKKISFVFIILLLATCSFSSPIDEHIVILKYNALINGLTIEVLWKPRVLMNGYATGPAIIQLTNEEYGISSTVVSNNFTISGDRANEFIEWRKSENEDTKVQRILSKIVSLQYINPKIPEDGYTFGTTEEPFFFYDLNFDGKKEFLVFEGFTGQRGGSAFKTYELDGSEYFVLKNEYQQITYDEPYILLDGGSTIDKEKKVIKIYYSGGVGESETHIYELKPSHKGSEVNKFILKSIINHKADIVVDTY